MSFAETWMQTLRQQIEGQEQRLSAQALATSFYAAKRDFAEQVAVLQAQLEALQVAAPAQEQGQEVGWS